MLFTLEETILKIKEYYSLNTHKNASVALSRCKNGKYKKLYDSVLFYYSWLKTTTNIFSVAIYCILHDITEQPKCSNNSCNNLVDFYQPSKGGFRKYCSISCASSDPTVIKIKHQTHFNNYGYNTHSQMPEEKIKLSKACFKMNAERPESLKQIIVIKMNEFNKNNFDCNTGWLPSAIETRLKNNNLIPFESKQDFIKYRYWCEFYTNINDLSLFENHEKRDNHWKNADAYHLDHIVSVFDGFKNNIPSWIIGSKYNLRFIHYKQNLSKSKKSDMLIEDLINYFYDDFSSSKSFCKLGLESIPATFKNFK